MFPDIDTDDWNMRQQGVLVCCGDDIKPLSRRVPSLELILLSEMLFEGLKRAYEPTPTRAMNRGSSGIELFLEFLNGTEGFDDFILQRAVTEFTPMFGGRREILPEEGMVDMTFL